MRGHSRGLPISKTGSGSKQDPDVKTRLDPTPRTEEMKAEPIRYILSVWPYVRA